jgi:TetR/AcrR family transcriptional regulator, mexJK operon transcriptional repressor
MSGQARIAVLSPTKRAQILEGGRAAFNAHGYERATVDEVAARAGVSKATVYNHFRDKQALFLACFAGDVDAKQAEFLGLLGPPDGELQASLQRVGERLVRFMISPELLCLYRHTSAEAARFPELGATFFERGPGASYEALAVWLRGWQAQGHLALDDARAAAVQFVLLCHGELVVRAQLAVGPTPSDAQVRQTVARAVRTFLRAYAH